MKYPSEKSEVYFAVVATIESVRVFYLFVPAIDSFHILDPCVHTDSYLDVLTS